jgi:two-component system NtrC family sensor kinase
MYEIKEVIVVGFIFLSICLLVIAFVVIKLYRVRRAKKKQEERAEFLNEQNIELERKVEEPTAELKNSLTELKAMQAHLIQSEKMAASGQLTTGVAHEIQNPLNFVNNFSEVSKEMIREFRTELSKGKRDLQFEDEILSSLEDNLEKINQHGNRAGLIVKGMLEHARPNTGKKRAH